jgi:DNA-binding MarR family transcriptional regulator
MDEIVPLHVVPRLEHAVHTVAVLIERSLGDLRLSQAEAHVLAYLAQAGHCSINDLHISFGHKRSTLTSLLDRLERRGLVGREPHPTSRRLVQLQLTDQGQRAGEQVGIVLHALESGVLAQTADADVAAFLRVLAAIEESAK